MDTKAWLYTSLELTSGPCLFRCGRSWEPVAGFRRCGSVFAIYKDATSYCVHGADTWGEGDEPNLGYYDAGLSWDALLTAIAERYDAIRSKLLGSDPSQTR